MLRYLLGASLLICVEALAPCTLLAQTSGSPSIEGLAAKLDFDFPTEVATVSAARLSEEVNIDGRHTDAAWAAAPVISQFTQRDPEQGAEPTFRTEVRILYDDEALYVSARMFDSAPDSIVARLGRRDNRLDSDDFTVYLDPFLDRRTGYFFGINAAGTLRDGTLENDDWDDEDWDGVWVGKAIIDDEGWCAEFRIPFSQLRFQAAEDHEWGINFRRSIARKNESDFLVYTPRKESGFVSRFPTLQGLRGIAPKRQLDVIPYIRTRAEFLDHADDDPFNDGSSYSPGVGADFRVGVTSNLTLNATVNPDFGQVEVDPAVVNLSDVETFFPEKRPFFIEGNSVFNGFGRGGTNNMWGFNFSNPNFFYSRRIGRAPQGRLPANDYAERIDGARIIGATKLTGRINGGWNLGTIHSLTERAVADFALDGDRTSAEVEPLAYYGVNRLQKEFSGGRQALGVLSTVAVRDFREDRLRSQINQSAVVVGLDGWTFLDSDKVWVLTGWSAISNVSGTADRMVAVQTDPRRYFQRPDAKYASVDSSATSLSGSAGRLMLNKQSGRFGMNAALGYYSPSFDVNDLGFLFRSDIINGHVVLSYDWPDPGSWYRRVQVYSAAFNSSDFDGNTTWRGVWAANWIRFLNYHEVWLNVAYNPETVSNRRTRGGPLTLNQPGLELNFEYDTDSRKRLVWEIGGYTYLQEDSDFLQLYTEFVWQPASNVRVTLNPRASWNNEFSQYVGTFDDPTATATFGKRYVFAELDQVTVSSSVRLNWTFTPTMSLQLFAQPLISSGNYFNYKELAAPRTYDFVNYGESGTTFDADNLVVDPDGPGPARPIELPDQDFNFRSLRGTAVLRWEYMPGSTLFLVWTQSRSDSEDIGRLDFGPSVRDLFGAKPDNIFAIKLTYWFSR
ncbi:MAG: carbohydrate binding family 9 domain-containing protein [Rhodothermia bacterium]|nr:carbohydrate binding family 9 domain-containing protein [Rhodothermia bacterium]